MTGINGGVDLEQELLFLPIGKKDEFPS